MNVLEVQNLYSKRGIKNILKDISFSVGTKEHTILFGLNGCGKTTLLATIAGYMGYTSGEIKLWDQLMTEENTVSLRRQVGFVSNSYFDRCYRKENILSIVLSGLYGQLGERYSVSKYDAQRAKRMLKNFGLKEKMDYPYDLLSRGQQQRVLIARALIAKPKLLLLDEPYTGLDVMARQFFLNTIEQIALESDTTIICVSHYEEEILPIFTKALLMKNGVISKQGDIKSVFSNDILTDFFEKKTQVDWNENRMHFKISNSYHADKMIWEE